jgi:hypothetical protein
MGSLAFWSAVAFIVRLTALVLLIYIARLQFNEFQFKTTLQPLKRLLFYFVIAIVVSNFPILYLNGIRILGQTGSPTVTDFATVSNALGMLLAAGLLLAVYRYKGND